MSRRIVLCCFIVTIFAAISQAGIRHVPSSYATIQAGIDSSATGDTVLVDPGTYYENINFHGKKILVGSQFTLTRNLQDIQHTIINGSQSANPDTQSVVLFITGEDTSSILEGFTITGGKGTAWKDEHSNGTFREGGGILCAFTAPIIRYNVIAGNTATDKVGLASAGGGGIRSGDGNPTIVNNVIMLNTGHYGAGIVLNFCGGLVRNNVIYKNSGGRDFGGAGIWINGANAKPKLIENNTIVDNAVTQNSGGGILIQSATATARNNIVWGNSATTDPQISISSATMPVTYSDVQGGFNGPGNINFYPLYSDSGLRLKSSSPAIDAGNPSGAYNDPEDSLNPGFALFPSLGTVRNDMGAYGGGHRSLLPYFDDHASDPLPPSTLGAGSDYLTPTSVHLSWHDPVTRRDSTPLFNFRIHIYRDSLLVASVDSGIQVFDDTGLVNHRRYVYHFLTSAGTDSSTADSVIIFAGGSAFPQPPSEFSVDDANEGIHLHWRNPSRQADGTPLNDLAYMLLYRDDVLFDSVAQTSADTGQARSYADIIYGYHQYRVVARDNETPTHFSTSTPSALGFGGITTSYSNDFEHGLGASFYRVGPWDTTSHLAHGGTHSLTDSPGGDYATLQVLYVYMPPVILGPTAILRFDQIAIVRPTGSVLVDISHNNRKTFSALRSYDWNSHPQWQDQSADSTDWVFEHIDLSGYAGDTVVIRFRLLSGAFPADGWYIDNVYLGPSTYPISISQRVDTGWNLVSLPVKSPSHLAGDLYPFMEGRAFSYSGTYTECDTLTEGAGYWIRSAVDSQVTLTGTSLVKTSIGVTKGWNTIGALSIPVSAASVAPVGTTINSNFFGYRAASGYTPADTLTPGSGYWVRVSASGQLSVKTDSVLMQPKISPTIDKQSLLTFTFEDDRRQRRELFASSRDVNTDRQSFALPPKCPGNDLDVRFGTGSFLELSDPREARTIPIDVSAAVAPLSITWKGTEHNSHAVLSIDGKTIDLKENGGITLEHLPERIDLKLSPSSAPGLPESFALGQNYPNPFNPATTIAYQLPASKNGDAPTYRVTLEVYNLLGQLVETLVNESEEAGYKSVRFEMKASGSGIPSGVYFYRLEANNMSGSNIAFVEMKKMLLMK